MLKLLSRKIILKIGVWNESYQNIDDAEKHHCESRITKTTINITI
jgi:hypothetical protein